MTETAQVRYPLLWPSDIPRTPIKDREIKNAWKMTERQTIAALEVELGRFRAFAIAITRKDPSDIRGAEDPSVAIYFSRRREDDFSWQSALAIPNPDPTVEEIGTAFRRLSQKHHPDAVQQGSGGDIETFHALFRHKTNALAYVSRLHGRKPDYCISCDKFREARWNINAVRNTIHSLRQMERDGTSGIVERAMVGFAALEAPREEKANVTG